MKNRTEKREYHIWWRIKQACYNKNAPNFKKFGAIGITLCDKWKDFDSFLNEMGEIDALQNTLILKEGCLEFNKLTCEWGYKNKGRPRLDVNIKSRNKNVKRKVEKPKPVLLVIEKEHVEYLEKLALHKSIESKKQIGVNDLIRESVNKTYPMPKNMDIFGGFNA